MLGPLLFLCYINDITCGVSSSIKLYTDDILIYRIISTEDNCKVLQKDLLQSWANKCNMSLNPMKCEFLRILINRTKFFFSCSIQDTLIKEVTQAKYLGITLNSKLKLTWSDHNSVYGFIWHNFNIAQLKSKVHFIRAWCDLFWNMLVMFGPHIIIRVYNV